MVGRPGMGRELKVTVLGQVGASRDGQAIALQKGQRQLLALLVAVGAEGAELAWLAEEIWGENQPSRWQESLRMALSRLRKRLDLELKPRNGRYRLGLDRRAVDAWELLDLDRVGRDWDPALEPYVSAVGVFPGIELSPGLERAAAELAAAQRSAVERLSRQPEQADGPLLNAVARHLDEDPYDENLCFAGALIHVHHGRRDQAVAMIDRCIEARREALGRSPAPQLEQLRLDIIEHRPADGARPHRADPAPAREIRPPAAVSIDRFRSPHFVGRQAELEALGASLDPQQPAVVVVRGRPACGKTALLAELMARAAEQGAYVVRIAGASGERVGLGPFSSALSEFRATLAGGAHLDVNAVARKGLLAARLVDVMDRQAMGRRVVLVVDDAHWLDSMSCDLIDYLAHSAETGTGTISLVLAARRAEQHDPWTELQTSLDRLPHLVSLELQPLCEHELTELVARHRPDDAFAQQAQLARWIFQVSDGLPGVATAMLDGRSDPLGSGGVSQIFDHLLEPLTPATRTVGVAAAVLGSTFQAADLALLLERDEALLDDPLEDLHHRQLITETGRMGRYEFTHQLVVDAFLRSGLASRRARLHLAASRLTTNDMHRLARHLLAAGPLVPAAERRAAALASAHHHLADGAFFESVTAFRAAAGVDDDDDSHDFGSDDDGSGDGPSRAGDGVGDTATLDAASRVGYATALALAGMRAPAAVVRAQAYHQAMAEGRWDLALDAAVSGLPGAEVQDGEPDRLTQLEAIDPERLDPARRLAQSLVASRQAAMGGDLQGGLRWADRARTLATEDEDRVQAALARRFVDAALAPPADRLQRMADAVAGLRMSAGARCRLTQFAAIDQIEQGDTTSAAATLEEFADLATTTGDTLRQWHALIFRAMLHDIDGDWATADTLADRALALGRRHGLIQADIVRLSQLFFRLRISGQLDLLAPGLDGVPEPDGDSLLFASAKASILDAVGRHDDAAEQALRIARRALEQPSTAGLASLAMVTPLVGRHGGPSQRAAARAALAPFAGGAMIVGAGLGNLGPVDFLVASLDRPTGRQLEQVLRRSISLADRFGLRSWSVRYRLDLAAARRSEEPLEEARALAYGTDLAPVVDQAG